MFDLRPHMEWSLTIECFVRFDLIRRLFPVIIRKRERSLSSPSAQSVTTHRWERRCYDCLPFMLFSCSSLPVTYWALLPLDVIDVGLPSSYPKCEWYRLFSSPLRLPGLFVPERSSRRFYLYGTPISFWWDLAQPTISGLVPNRRAVAPYASPLVWTWAALINARARLSTVTSFLTASKLSSGWTGPSSEANRWSLFASYLFIICLKTLCWNWWKLGWFFEKNRR